MRSFDHFPQGHNARCPVCGTDDDKPCFLLPIDGTSNGHNCEAIPTHVDCIREHLDQLRYLKDMDIIYMRVADGLGSEKKLEEKKNEEDN